MSWDGLRCIQHVHVCLLKQPSSAKKVSSASTTSRENQTTTPVRGGESATQLRELAKGASRSTGPTPPRGSLQPSHDLVRGGAVESRLSGWDERLPPPAESPRSTRVSLQGVFSPNVRAMSSAILHCPYPEVPFKGGHSKLAVRKKPMLRKNHSGEALLNIDYWYCQSNRYYIPYVKIQCCKSGKVKRLLGLVFPLLSSMSHTLILITSHATLFTSLDVQQKEAPMCVTCHYVR